MVQVCMRQQYELGCSLEAFVRSTRYVPSKAPRHHLPASYDVRTNSAGIVQQHYERKELECSHWTHPGKKSTSWTQPYSGTHFRIHFLSDCASRHIPDRFKIWGFSSSADNARARQCVCPMKMHVSTFSEICR